MYCNKINNINTSAMTMNSIAALLVVGRCRVGGHGLSVGLAGSGRGGVAAAVDCGTTLLLLLHLRRPVAHRVGQLLAYIAYALPDGLRQLGRRLRHDSVRRRDLVGGRRLVAFVRRHQRYGARVPRRPVATVHQPLRVQLDRVVVTGRRHVHHRRVIRRLLGQSHRWV